MDPKCVLALTFANAFPITNLRLAKSPLYSICSFTKWLNTRNFRPLKLFAYNYRRYLRGIGATPDHPIGIHSPLLATVSIINS